MTLLRLIDDPAWLSWPCSARDNQSSSWEARRACRGLLGLGTDPLCKPNAHLQSPPAPAPVPPRLLGCSRVLLGKGDWRPPTNTLGLLGLVPQNSPWFPWREVSARLQPVPRPGCCQRRLPGRGGPGCLRPPRGLGVVSVCPPRA